MCDFATSIISRWYFDTFAVKRQYRKMTVILFFMTVTFFSLFATTHPQFSEIWKYNRIGKIIMRKFINLLSKTNDKCIILALRHCYKSQGVLLHIFIEMNFSLVYFK